MSQIELHTFELNRQAVMIHKAKDLSPGQKMALESLLSRAISEQDEISIRLLQPPPGVSPERRQEILEALRPYFGQVDAQRQAGSPQEADDIINEALRSTRREYRPVR
jgi:hypothetical protein